MYTAYGQFPLHKLVPVADLVTNPGSRREPGFVSATFV